MNILLTVIEDIFFNKSLLNIIKGFKDLSLFKGVIIVENFLFLA